MRLTHMHIEKIHLPLRFTFTHARLQRSSNEVLLLKLTASDGRVGYGECQVRPYLTGETLEGAEHWLGQVFWPAAQSEEFSSFEQCTSFTDTFLNVARRDQCLAAFTAADLALHDLWQKEHRTMASPSYQVGIVPLLKSYWQKALVTLWNLTPVAAVKVKISPNTSAADIVNLYCRLRRRKKLILDANSQLTVGQFTELVKKIPATCSIIWEDPVAPDDLACIAKVFDGRKDQLMLDESIHATQDAERHLALGVRTLWNIRLGKIGGLSGFRSFQRWAEAHQQSLYLGSLVGQTSLLDRATARCAADAKVQWQEGAWARFLLRQDPTRKLI